MHWSKHFIALLIYRSVGRCQMRSRLRASCQASSVSWSLGTRVSVTHTSYELHENRFTYCSWMLFSNDPIHCQSTYTEQGHSWSGCSTSSWASGQAVCQHTYFNQVYSVFFDVFSAEMLHGLQSRRPQILCNLTAIEAMTQSRYAAKLCRKKTERIQRLEAAEYDGYLLSIFSMQETHMDWFVGAPWFTCRAKL